MEALTLSSIGNLIAGLAVFTNIVLMFKRTSKAELKKEIVTEIKANDDIVKTRECEAAKVVFGETLGRIENEVKSISNGKLGKIHTRMDELNEKTSRIEGALGAYLDSRDKGIEN